MDAEDQKEGIMNTKSNNPFANIDIFAAANPARVDRALFVQQPAVQAEVPADAPEGSYTYALVQSGPAVPAEEIEAQAEAIEVMILWGATILHVEHLSPARSFFVGEEGSDFVLPADKVGASKLPLVLVGKDAIARVILPATATGKVEIEGQSIETEKLFASGKAEACPELAGAMQVALKLGTRAKFEIGGVTFQISAVRAGRKTKGAVKMEGKGLPWHGVSLAIHAGLLAAAAFFMPPLGADEEGTISADDKLFMAQALAASAEPGKDKVEDKTVEAPTTAPGGGAGERADGSEGKAGSTTSRNSNGRMAFAARDNVDPQLARSQALDDAHNFGMIGMLSTLSGDPNAIASRWGGDITAGADPKSALGNMWGATLDDAPGGGAMGLSGNDEGGGGKSHNIGLTNIGDLGNMPGGLPDGFRRRLKDQRPHTPGAPSVRPLPVSASGQLPADVIQRIVRQNFGRYRFCYEQGLRGNPNLAGRVAVRFVIGRDGSVSSVQNGGSDMPDGNVVSCVVRSFYGLSFPAPENGIVTVTYPIMFQPGS
jgi:hypothetical protein